MIRAYPVANEIGLTKRVLYLLISLKFKIRHKPNFFHVCRFNNSPLPVGAFYNPHAP